MNSGQAAEQNPAALRTRRFKLALMTSLAGKGVSIIVQLAALPLAIAALGPERFGVYATLAALLNWASIVSVTITPGLTVQLLKASAEKNHEAEGKIFASAFFFALGLATFLLLGTQILFHATGIQGVFGSGLLKFKDELEHGLLILSVFLAANIILSVAEAAQAGYQNQYLQNIFLSLGNVITIAAITLIVRARPTIGNMIVAVYAGPLAARAASMTQLLWCRRYLVPRPGKMSLPILRVIVGTGSAFILTNIAVFCYQSFSVFWVGRQIGAIAAAQMSVCSMILNVSGSVLIMFTQPLWPAIQDATARNDYAWVRRSYARMSKLLMIYVGLTALALAIAGNHAVHLWIKNGIELDTASQFLLGLYFLLVAWEHTNYSFLIGLVIIGSPPCRFWPAH